MSHECKRIKLHSEMTSYLVVGCSPLNTNTLFFYKNVVFLDQAEYSRISVDFQTENTLDLFLMTWAYGISALECIGVSGNYQCSCRLS